MSISFSMKHRQRLASAGKQLLASPQRSLNLIRIVVAAALLALLVGQTSPAYAISCSVPALITAIDNANANAANSTINLAAGCTYNLTVVNNTLQGNNGLPRIASSAIAGTLTINGNGATIARSSVGAIPLFRIFYVEGGALTLNNMTVTNGNINNGGGGAIFNAGTVLISQVRLTNNRSVGGGAVYNDTSAVFTALSSEITGNTAATFGGGFANLNGAVQVINSTISGNSALGPSANGGGGAIDSYGPSPSTGIVNSTIVNNTAVKPETSGIWIETGILGVNNSIITNNNGANNCLFVAVAVFNDGGNNIENGTSCGFSGALGQNTNPLLGALANNGGLTQTYALQPGSPAINAGTNADARDNTGAALTTDQRGAGFPRIVGGKVDIGAYESAAVCPSFPYTVPAGDTAALLTAISCANGTASNDVINLTNSTYTLRIVNNTAYGASGLPVIRDVAVAGTLKINGNGAIIERGGIPAPPNFRIVYVEGGGNFTLNNVTLRGGFLTGIDAGNEGGAIASSGTVILSNATVTLNQTERGGGGIWSNGSLTLNNSDVTNNQTVGVGGGIMSENTLIIRTGSLIDANIALDGGGIYNWVGGQVTIDASTISNNEASGGHGGGIMTDEVGTVIVTNDSLISDNSSGEQGGGIYVGSSDTVVVINSTVADNSSVETGGGIYNIGTLTVTGSTIVGNETSVRGGGIFNNSANMTVSNSTITDNTAVGFTTGIGGGIDSEYDSYNVIVTNSTIARNTARDVGAIYAVKMTLGSNIIGENTAIGGISGGFNVNEQDGDFATIGYNVLKIRSGGFSGFLALDLHDETAVPLNLGVLANNGGPTQTIAIGAGSTAIGHGMCDWAQFGIIDVDTDQRGVNRKTPCDSGAYENFAAPPTISNVTNKSTNEDTITPAIAFTVGDPDTPLNSLTITGTSSNQTRVPNANIVFGGSGASRTVKITPAANQTGSATITLTVSDGTSSATDTFVLSITAVNDPPVISNVVSQQTLINTPASGIPFTISDVDNSAGTLTVTGSSSNTTLLPVANIVFGGSGANRTVTLTPAANQTGTATVTLTVRDASSATDTDNFVFTVRAANDPIFSDGFESGNLSAWTSNANDGGDLSVTAGAALRGSFGLRTQLDDANAIYVTDDTSGSELQYRARFYFDPNTLAMANGDNFVLFYGYHGTTSILQMQFRRSGTSYQVRLGTLDDASVWVYTGYVTVSDAPHLLELDWRAATGIGANNGTLTLWVDEVMQTPVKNIDNDTRRVTRGRLGAVSGIDAGTNGTIYFDAFVSRRLTYIGPEAGGLAAPTATPTPTPVSTFVMPPIYDDMENAGSNWEAAGNWSLGAEAGYGGSGQGWTANGGTENILRWRQILDLRSAQSAQLSFDSALNSRDRLWVQISFEGISWVNLAEVTGSQDWQHVTVDLTPFKGQVIQLRFLWQSARGQDTWRFDNFRVE